MTGLLHRVLFLGFAVVAVSACKTTSESSDTAGIGSGGNIANRVYSIKGFHKVNDDLKSLLKESNAGAPICFTEMNADVFYSFSLTSCPDVTASAGKDKFIYIDPGAIERRQDQVLVQRDGIPVGEAFVTYNDKSFQAELMELCTDVFAANCKLITDTPFYKIELLKQGDPAANNYVRGTPTAADWKRRLDIKFSQIPQGGYGIIWFQNHFTLAKDFRPDTDFYQGNYMCRWFWDHRMIDKPKDPNGAAPTASPGATTYQSMVFTRRWMPQLSTLPSYAPQEVVTPEGVKINLGFVRDTDERNWSTLQITKIGNDLLNVSGVGQVSLSKEQAAWLRNVDEQSRQMHLRRDDYRIYIKEMEKSGFPYRWAECIFE